MSRSQRRAMIDREEPNLSLVRQCALLGISRSSLYYLPTEAGAEDLELMALIDQQYLKTPFSSGPHHQDSGEAKIRESTAGVSRKPSSDGKACGCSSKHLCGLTAWNT